MDEYGRYWKTYTFEDGAQWCEAMSPEYVSQEVEVKMCKMNIEVKMFRTEFGILMMRLLNIITKNFKSP